MRQRNVSPNLECNVLESLAILGRGCFLAFWQTPDSKQGHGKHVVRKLDGSSERLTVKPASLHAHEPVFDKGQFHGANGHAHAQQCGVVFLSRLFKNGAGDDAHNCACILHPIAVGLHRCVQQHVKSSLAAQGDHKAPRLVVVRGAAQARRLECFGKVVPRQSAAIECTRAVSFSREFKKAHGPKNKEDCRMFAPSCEVKSTDDIAWSRAFFRGDEAQASIVCAGHEDHALTLDAAQFPWCQVDQKGDLAADDVFRGKVLGDAADDGAGVEACVDGELEKLVGLGDLFAFKDGSDTKVQFGEVVEGDFVFGRHEFAG